MRYVFPAQPVLVAQCRVTGHHWPTRMFPWWRALLGLPQTCHRCGLRRYAS